MDELDGFIKKQEFYDTLDGGYDVNLDELPGTKAALLEMIADFPAADVVEVVRCKDCEYCSLLFNKRPLCFAGRAWIQITENDFCAWGKKRANDG